MTTPTPRRAVWLPDRLIAALEAQADEASTDLSDFVVHVLSHIAEHGWGDQADEAGELLQLRAQVAELRRLLKDQATPFVEDVISFKEYVG